MSGNNSYKNTPAAKSSTYNLRLIATHDNMKITPTIIRLFHDEYIWLTAKQSAEYISLAIDQSTTLPNTVKSTTLVTGAGFGAVPIPQINRNDYANHNGIDNKIQWRNDTAKNIRRALDKWIIPFNRCLTKCSSAHNIRIIFGIDAITTDGNQSIAHLAVELYKGSMRVIFKIYPACNTKSANKDDRFDEKLWLHYPTKIRNGLWYIPEDKAVADHKLSNHDLVLVCNDITAFNRRGSKTDEKDDGTIGGAKQIRKMVKKLKGEPKPKNIISLAHRCNSNSVPFKDPYGSIANKYKLIATGGLPKSSNKAIDTIVREFPCGISNHIDFHLARK